MENYYKMITSTDTEMCQLAVTQIIEKFGVEGFINFLEKYGEDVRIEEYNYNKETILTFFFIERPKEYTRTNTYILEYDGFYINTGWCVSISKGGASEHKGVIKMY